jgi:hypothetical protein
MGYETDTYTLASAMACTGAATPGVATAGSLTFGGSDFVRGVLRMKFTAVTTAPTTLALLLQNQDQSGGGATDWYPNPAAIACANFVTALTAKDPNNPTFVGGVVPLTTSPATTDRYSIPIDGPGFPGGLFRLVVLAIGASAAFSVTVQGDFQKWVADQS